MKRNLAGLVSVIMALVVAMTCVPTLCVASASTSSYSSDLTELEQAIYESCINMDSEIDVSSFNVTNQQVYTAEMNILNKRPEMFYVYQIAYNMSIVSGRVQTIKPAYIFSANELAAEKMEFNAAVSEMLDGITDDMPDVQKLLLIHDRIILRSSYDKDGEENDTLENYQRTAYGALVTKSGAGEAYARAFKLLADRCGVKNEIVYLDMSMWNQVYVDGEWYNIDTIADETVPNSFVQVKHNRFLVSDTVMRKNGDFGSNGATSTKYDGADSAIWKKNQSAFVLVGDVCVYAKQNGEIGTYDFKTDTATVLTKVKAQWPVKSGSDNTTYYAIKFTSVAYYNGMIYYNTPYDICTIRPDGTGNSIIYTYSVDERLICGVGLIDGKVHFALRKRESAASSLEEARALSATAKALSRIEVSQAPDKTVYLTGSEFNADGMVVTAHYNDGSKFNLLSSDYKITGFSSDAIGKKTLTVSYGNKTCYQEVSIVRLGDIDADFLLTSTDLLMIQQHILKISEIPESVIDIANTDGKDGISASDLLTLQMLLLGMV